MNRIFLSSAALLLTLARLGLAGQASVDGGSAIVGDASHGAQLEIVPLTGYSSNSTYGNYIGHLKVTLEQTKYFLTIDFPLAVRVEPGSPSGSSLVVSPSQQMTLAWTDGTNTVPVTYSVYFGTDSVHMSSVTVSSDRTYLVKSLDFARSYYWKIDTTDIYGRHTFSPLFTFSIAPAIDHFYCAPNPFRAGRESTRFIYSSPPGNVPIKIYALPHGDLVYAGTITATLDGENTWSYDGRDNRGAALYDGVYMAVLDVNGHGKEHFKFIVAK
jgi:hypothetical protein